MAQLAAAALCPEAWWINLTGREPIQTDTLFLALARRIESGNCPSLVIIDDLDVSTRAHRVYRDALSLVLLRANATGRSVILTAQGASHASAVMQDFPNIELLDVPGMNTEETANLCSEYGCPEALSKTWGSIVTATTLGHPKLVQVRIADLASRGWPKPNSDDFITQPLALKPVRQVTRDLLASSVSDSVAEFVYLVSECSLLLRRPIAIQLAESVGGITNAGDVLDNLTGKWFECIEGNWFRATALLQGAVGEVWSPEKRKLGHVLLYKAILANSPLDPSEAAALLFHAFFAQDRVSLTHTAIRLQTLESHDVKEKVERQLLWLPFVSLDYDQSFTDDPTAGVILRQLQFRVASTLNADTLPQIVDRWLEEIEQVSHPQVRPPMLSIAWLSLGLSQNIKVPLKRRLQAVSGIGTLPTELQNIQAEANRSLLGGEDVLKAGIPPTATTEQMMLLFSNQNVRSAASLEELLHWLDNEASDNLRQQFDIMLEWPVTQAVGAFIQGAWAAKHEETSDWEPWLTLLGRVDDYSKRRASPRFGREAAKAKAIILAEYLNRAADALAALDTATRDFGASPVLLEQRANVIFYTGDDKKVLEIWKELSSDPACKVALDPFAYRRAGISSARLNRWQEAEGIFLGAIASIVPGQFDLTKFGLQVDTALIAHLKSDPPCASAILAEAVLAMPPAAAVEGDLRWDAVQRVAVEVCKTIEESLWKKGRSETRIKVGDASSPILRAPKAEPGQAARTELTRIQALHPAATLGIITQPITDEVERLSRSRYVYVRWFASEARLALIYASGAGAGFTKALVALETALVDVSLNRERLIEPDTGPPTNLAISPERWLGLIVAGMICSGADLIDHLQLWLDESIQQLGRDAAITNAVRLLLDGASRPADTLEATVINTANSVAIRCGSAAKLLVDSPVAGKTLQLQEFLVSAFFHDASAAKQELFNLHVARHFASSWRALSESRFQFSSPRTSVPALLQTIENIERGRGTLGQLLHVANNALGKSMDSTMKTVN